MAILFFLLLSLVLAYGCKKASTALFQWQDMLNNKKKKDLMYSQMLTQSLKHNHKTDPDTINTLKKILEVQQDLGVQQNPKPRTDNVQSILDKIEIQ